MGIQRSMLSAPAALVVDFLEWLAAGPKPYDEVMEAWRTSCPRLTVWEDALDEGFVVRNAGGGTIVVELTSGGRAFLAQARRAA